MVVLIGVNIAYILINQVERIKSNRRKNLIKKLQEQRVEIYKSVLDTKKLINARIIVKKKIMHGPEIK